MAVLRGIFLWPFFGLCVPVGLARAGPDEVVARAQALFDTLKFEAAEQAVAAALCRPGRGPEDLAALYRLRGLIYAARDDQARAEADFTRWLSLEPNGKLPPEVAPKIMSPFAAAQRGRKGKPGLELRPYVLSTGAKGPLLRVEVRGDRGRMGQAVVLRYAVGSSGGTLLGEVPAQRGGDRVTVDLPLIGVPFGPGPGRRMTYFVELIEEHGSRLAQAGSLASPLVAEPPGATPAYRRWWFWTAVAGVVGVGLGVGFGVKYR